MEQFKKKYQQFKKSPWYSLWIKVILTVIIICLLLQFVFGIHVYHGNNMAPSMNDGSLIITYKLDKNLYSDLVISYHVESLDTIRFGRIIGVPGDVINITDNGNYTINGNVTSEHVYYNTFKAENGIQYPYTVPENSYFIMNDYREDTLDSRELGAIHIDDIIGQEYIELQRRGF